MNCVKQRLQFLRPPQSPEQQPVTIEVDVINSHNPLKFFDDLSTNDVTEVSSKHKNHIIRIRIAYISKQQWLVLLFKFKLYYHFK